MKKASIVCIGNELLSGTVVDTNTSWLCSHLQAMGIPVASGYTVVDEMERIVATLKQALSDADIVLITGGLGPTDDDLTRQAMAEMLGVKLVLVPKAVEEMGKFFADRGVHMVEKNLIQAHIPEGTEIIHNSIGTAPGVWWQKGDKVMASMPGVPAEMEVMFKDEIEARLRGMAGSQVVEVRKLHCFGAGESSIAEKLGDLMKRGRNPLINTTANIGAVTLYIVAEASSHSEAARMIEADERLLRSLVGEYIYGADGQTLAEAVGRAMARNKQTLAVAESCTGGLLAKMITDIPGSSDYFMQGWVTYSNDSKVRELGVPAELIERHGAVSPEVAEAMAKGARKTANADFAIGITGIAGPGGGTQEKQEGLVYISLDSQEGCQTRKCRFMRGRDAVRLRASLTALDMLRGKLRFD
jgi:nicotinamide-nucleotide amidase